MLRQCDACLKARWCDATRISFRLGSEIMVISTGSDGWPKNHIREMNQELVPFVTEGWQDRRPILSVAAEIWNAGNISHTMSCGSTCEPLVLAWQWRVSKWSCHVERLIILFMAKCWGSRSLSLARVFGNISLCFSSRHRQSQEAPMKEDGSKLQWRRCHPFSVYPDLVCRVDWQSHMHIRHGYIQSYIHFDPFDPFKMSPWSSWKKQNSS